MGERIGKALVLIVLLPNVLPVLFIILSVLNIIRPFPFGLWGIVIVHSIINVGLVSVLIQRLFQHRLGGISELALIEGASRWRFLLHCMSYLKGELASLFLFVFTVCFTSFAVPLVLGGSSGTTMEVFIFEKIRLEGALGQALALSCIQVLVLIGMALLLMKDSQPLRSSPSHLDLLRWQPGLLFPLVATGLALSGLINGLFQGYVELQLMPELKSVLRPALVGSGMVIFGTGLLSLSCLLCIAFCHPHKNFARFLTGYIAPSSVLTGFAFWMIWSSTGPAVISKIIIGLTLICLPLLYRLRWGALLESLNTQIEVARTMGASWQLVYSKIVFPQVIRDAGYLSGLAALWASGDFAFSRIVATKNITLALVVDGLIGSYRIEIATLLVWLLILLGVIGFIFYCGFSCARRTP